jgi:hypothetical protein
MPYQTVSLTSNSTTTSGPMALNWIGGKPSTVSLSFTGSSQQTTDATIQYTLDDIMRTASSLVVWLPVASSAGSSTPAHYSGTFFDTGVTLSFLNPVAAVRLGSTTLSSGTLTLKVIQGEGW